MQGSVVNLKLLAEALDIVAKLAKDASDRIWTIGEAEAEDLKHRFQDRGMFDWTPQVCSWLVERDTFPIWGRLRSACFQHHNQSIDESGEEALLDKHRATGVVLLLSSVLGIAAYAWLLFLFPVIVLKLTAFLGVTAILVMFAWVGWTLVTSSPPEPIDYESSTATVTEHVGK
jgi:hypothetical protein